MYFLHDEPTCFIKDATIVISKGRTSGLADHKPAQEEQPQAGLRRLGLETEKLAPVLHSCYVRDVA